MKFVFADSMDYVDPRYDFAGDQHGEARKPYWDDQFPHEILGYAPYDGMLVSRAIVGDHRFPGRYTEPQAMRFRRDGARKFLRFDGPRYADKMIMGDCGAFSYSKMSRPPYGPDDTVEFYGDGRFTHGLSIDHIVFEFDPNARGMAGGSQESRDRFEITLELAEAFLKSSKALGPRFTPIGVVQGWSPESMAKAARSLIAMGYRYLAIGGLVPLKTNAIHQAVSAVDEAISTHSDARIHLLGFAKADEIGEFERYRVASFDTTSPLLRAFKDARRNYYLPDHHGRMHYYTAIRIPQALENAKLKRQVQTGRLDQEELESMERAALGAVRAFDRGQGDLDTALDRVLEYSRPLHWSPTATPASLDKRMETLRSQYRRTLNDRPWKACGCPICKDVSVEVILFRGSNRNKRRGIHNLAIYEKHLKALDLR
jgi:hypothetical protein